MRNINGENMEEYYKNYGIVNGKSKWIYFDEYGNIVDNLTNEQRKLAKTFKYNPGDICRKIKENKEVCGEAFHGTALREHNKDGKHTGEWICHKCYDKFDPNSSHNIRKSLGNRRTGNQDPYHNHAKGDLFEELTCQWKNVKNLNNENDSYTIPVDHSADSKGKIPQTRGGLYRTKYCRWQSGSSRNEYDKKFDYLIFYCASSNGKIIERIYEIPREEFEIRESITIYKNPMNSRGTKPVTPWYEKYRIKDEDEIKKINEIWRKITKGKKIFGS